MVFGKREVLKMLVLLPRGLHRHELLCLIGNCQVQLQRDDFSTEVLLLHGACLRFSDLQLGAPRICIKIYFYKTIFKY